MKYDELWQQGHIDRVSQHVVNVNLEGSEQDIVNIVLGRMCHVVRQQSCTSSTCSHHCYMDTMRQLLVPSDRFGDVQQWLQEIFLGTSSNCCVDNRCDGIRSMSAYTFEHGFPSVLVICVPENASFEKEVAFPRYLHVPHSHPREQ